MAEKKSENSFLNGFDSEWNSYFYPERKNYRGNRNGPILADTGMENVKEGKNKEKLNVPHGTVENYGWDTQYYPERHGGKFETSWWKKLIGLEARGEGTLKLSCERNVYKCIKESPMVKLLIGAMKSSGCEIDIRRHITCEMCDRRIAGGYDPVTNQVIICQNVATSQGRVQSTLAHEFVHMFDFCRHNLDFRNIDHVACSEIRAANLTGCSFLGSFLQGIIPHFTVKKAHRECVKYKATISVLAVRNVSQEEARAAVDRVFDRCYADLEPIGRRIKRNSKDMQRSYKEGYYYGYVFEKW